jgi:hypothetical protein
MMVPSDARIFFNDVMKGGITPQVMNKQDSQVMGEAGNDDDDPLGKDSSAYAVEPRSVVRRTMTNRR